MRVIPFARLDSEILLFHGHVDLAISAARLIRRVAEAVLIPQLIFNLSVGSIHKVSLDS